MSTVDLTEFEELSRRGTQRRPCQVAAAREQVSPGEQAALDAALANTERVSVGGVQKWFEKRGHDVSVPAITNHRRRKCLCHV